MINRKIKRAHFKVLLVFDVRQAAFFESLRRSFSPHFREEDPQYEMKHFVASLRHSNLTDGYKLVPGSDFCRSSCDAWHLAVRGLYGRKKD